LKLSDFRIRKIQRKATRAKKNAELKTLEKIIAIGLWIAHTPSVPIASEEAHRSCPEHCEKMCAKSSQK
jgi:hypothetical protein